MHMHIISQQLEKQTNNTRHVHVSIIIKLCLICQFYEIIQLDYKCFVCYGFFEFVLRCDNTCGFMAKQKVSVKAHARITVLYFPQIAY